MKNQARLKAYCKKIVEGKIVAGNYFKLACKRFLDDCKRTDISWDEDLAEKVVQLTQFMNHWEGQWRGKTVELNNFQKFVLLNIFCWKKNGKRRFTHSYIQLARKNAKTTLVGIACIISLLLFPEETPQIMVGANNEDQAKICVNSVGQIWKASPDLYKLINPKQIYTYKGKIVSLRYKDGSIEAMSRDPETKDGFNPFLGVIDEYHEAKTDKLLNVIESGQGARHPFMICITTAGFRREGPCYANLRSQSVKMLTGQIEDDAQFSVICELDSEEEVHDPKNWIKANPMIDDIETLRPFVEGRYLKAKNEGGTKWVDFLTKNMNIWTDAPEIWIKDEDWMKNFKHELDLEWFRGKECYGGLDLSISTDLTAFVIIHEDADEIIHILPFFWIPEARLSYDKFDYVRARMEGHLFVSDGNVVDHTHVINTILDVAKVVNFKSIGYDSYLFNKTILQVIDSNALPFNEVKQRTKEMHAPTDTFHKLALEEKLNHGNNPILRWNVSQVVLKLDPEGAFKPTKEKGNKKIDGVMATLNAVSEWMRPQYRIENVDQIFQ